MEPGATLETQNFTAFIEAKYKSYLLNRSDGSGVFDQDLRRDRDLVLAYAATTKTGRGIGVMCYPSKGFEVTESTITDSSPNICLMIGIPLRR